MNFEVIAYTAAAAVIGLVPLPYPLFILLLGIAAGYGAYRRQHSRYIMMVESSHYVSVSHKKEADVGLSDVLFVGVAAVTLQCLRVGPTWTTYAFAMIAQFSVIVGMLLAYHEYREVEAPAPRKDSDSSVSLLRQRIISGIVLRRMNLLSLLYLGSAPLLAVIFFGAVTPAWLLFVMAAELVASWTVTFLPDLHLKHLHGRLQDAIAADDIPTILDLRRSPKLKHIVREYLADRAHADWTSFVAAVFSYLLNRTIPLGLRAETAGDASSLRWEPFVDREHRDDAIALLQEADRSGDSWIAYQTVCAVTSNLVGSDLVGDQEVVVVRDTELTGALLEWICDPDRTLEFRVGTIRAFSVHSLLMSLPQVQEMLKQAREDPALVKELHKRNLTFA